MCKCFAILSVVLALWPWFAQSKTIMGHAHVIDADTLWIGQKKVRLIGVDAPESNQVCRRNGGDWYAGQDATSWLRQWIEGSRVTCEVENKGRYGRWLGTCFYGEYTINAEVVRAGWAEAYTEYSMQYVMQELLARIEGIGIWSGHCMSPSQWRRR